MDAMPTTYSDAVSSVMRSAVDDLVRTRRTLQVTLQAARNENDPRTDDIYRALDAVDNAITRIPPARTLSGPVSQLAP
jgi:DNA-binding ferritin-like protein